MLRLSKMFVVLLACGWVGISQAALTVPHYQQWILPNGLTLLLMERHDVPLIAFSALLRGGALTDTTEQAGAATVLADLLMKGAGKRTAAEFAAALDAQGAWIETAATLEALSIRGQFLARDQALMVDLLADLLQRPQLNVEEFERLRVRHIAAIRGTKDSEPSTLLTTYAAATLFGAHPYAKVVTGSEDSLGALRYETVRQSYTQHVGADRLILAIAGDFKTAALKRRINKAFGSWQRAPGMLPSATAPPVVQGCKVLLIDTPGAEQTYFWIGNVGVARAYPQRAALEVINTVLGGRFTSMLNNELRVRAGLTYSAHARYQFWSQAGSWGMVSFTPTATTTEAVDLTLQVYNRLWQNGLNIDTLTSGQRYVLGQFPTAYETAQQWAAVLAEWTFYGLRLNELKTYSTRVLQLQPEQVLQVVRQVYSAPTNLQFIFMGDAVKIRKRVRQYGPVTELKLVAPRFGEAIQP